MNRRLAVLAALVIAACSPRTPTLNGFKDITFGMSQSEMQNLGFTCSSQYSCDQSNASSTQGPKGYTIFGQPASVSATMDKGKVSEISLLVHISPTEMMNLLKHEYGEPHEFEFDTLYGRRASTTYWIFNNKTSISLVNGGQIPQLPYDSTVSYLDQSATERMVALEQKSKVNPHDI